MPIYKDEEVAKSFEDIDIHKQISKLISKHSTNKNDIRNEALKQIDFLKITNILDLGSGFGFFTLALRDKIKEGAHILGLDREAKNKKPFIKNCRKIGSTCEFHVTDANDIATYPPHSFDLIISSYAIYFFKDVLKHIPRMLTPEGTFVVLTHSQNSLSELTTLIKKLLADNGIKVSEKISFEKLLSEFSLENGKELLTPHFEEINIQEFKNSLIFKKNELCELFSYIEMHKNLFFKELLDKKPDHVEAAKKQLFDQIVKETQNEFILDKTDGVFICRKPISNIEAHINNKVELYCPICGGDLLSKTIEHKERKFCSKCEFILYKNPIPVVSSIVMNEKKEILLVQRERHPMKDMWGLPSGFAEADENIEDAALRELEEETGIKGKSIRMIHAETANNFLYGNLVMIGFEVEQTGGKLKAGDDAIDAKFFPLDNLPPLAFESHDNVINKFIELSKDKWQIQDSFLSDAETISDDKPHISDTLINHVEKEASKITKAWLKKVRRISNTPSYHIFPKDKLKMRALTVVSHLGDWIKNPENASEIENFYTELGKERKSEGFELSEIILSFKTIRNEIINEANNCISENSLFDIFMANEFQMRIINFFDQAILYMVEGYTEF